MSLTVENKSFITNRLVDETESKRAMDAGIQSPTGNVSSEATIDFYLLMKITKMEKPNMLEREAWRFINNRRKDLLTRTATVILGQGAWRVIGVGRVKTPTLAIVCKRDGQSD